MLDSIEISELKIQLEESRRRFLNYTSALYTHKQNIIKSEQISELCEQLGLKTELNSYKEYLSIYIELHSDISKIHDYVDSITLPDSILNNKTKLNVDKYIRRNETYIKNLENALHSFQNQCGPEAAPYRVSRGDTARSYEALISSLLNNALDDVKKHLASDNAFIEINKKVDSMCAKQIKQIEDANKDCDRIQLRIKRTTYFIDIIKNASYYISDQKYSFSPETTFNQDDEGLVSRWTVIGNHKYNKLAMESARKAELAALSIYRNLYSEVQDISILQITNPSEDLWKLADIRVALDQEGNDRLIDVKNARRSFNSPDSYSEFCIPQYKYFERNDSEVIIASMLSNYSTVDGAKILTIRKISEFNDKTEKNKSWTRFDIETEEGYPLVTFDEHQANVARTAKELNASVNAKIKGPNKYGCWEIEHISSQDAPSAGNVILWLGETSNSKMKLLQNEFAKKNILEINFTRYNSENSFLPVWAFDYPKKYYLKRNNNIETLRLFSNSEMMKSASIPIRILGICNECEELDKACKIEFIKMLDYFSDLRRLTRPHLFLYILQRFIDCISSNMQFPSDSISKCVFGNIGISAEDGEKILTITKISEINGKTKKDKSWTRFDIETEEGYQLVTFDEHQANEVRNAEELNTPINVKIKGPNKYGRWEIEHISTESEDKDFPLDFPLSIHDPVRSVYNFINVLKKVDTYCQRGKVLAFKEFKLQNTTTLKGRNNSNDQWKTIIAHCGGRDLQTGARCGTNPIYLGQKSTKTNFEAKHCTECHCLICANCGFCSKDPYGVNCHLYSLRHNVIYGHNVTPHRNAPKYFLLKKGASWIQIIEYKNNFRIKFSDGESTLKDRAEAKAIWTKAKSEGYELAEKD